MGSGSLAILQVLWDTNSSWYQVVVHLLKLSLLMTREDVLVDRIILRGVMMQLLKSMEDTMYLMTVTLAVNKLQ